MEFFGTDAEIKLVSRYGLSCVQLVLKELAYAVDVEIRRKRRPAHTELVAKVLGRVQDRVHRSPIGKRFFLEIAKENEGRPPDG